MPGIRAAARCDVRWHLDIRAAVRYVASRKNSSNGIGLDRIVYRHTRTWKYHMSHIRRNAHEDKSSNTIGSASWTGSSSNDVASVLESTALRVK